MTDVAARLERTILWQDALGIPAAIDATLAGRAGIEAAAAALDRARRVVVSGNGASWYVSLAIWLASLHSRGLDLLAVPAGLLGSAAWQWREGDLLLAISSSGELNDLIAAQAAIGPGRSVAITSMPSSSIGRAASACAIVASEGQRSHTHTRSYCGSLVAGLSILAVLAADLTLGDALGAASSWTAAALAAAPRWLAGIPSGLAPTDAVTFGAGGAWPAALEAALLLKEVAGIPAEGAEAREGATSSTFALSGASLAVSIRTDADPQAREAEVSCAQSGAVVVSLPEVRGAAPALSPVSSFPYALALAARLAADRGLDVDHPAWVDRYLATVRTPEAGGPP